MWFQRQRICLYFQICWWAIQKRFLFKAELHWGTAPTSSLDLWVMQSYYTPGIAGYEENKPVIHDLYKHMWMWILCKSKVQDCPVTFEQTGKEDVLKCSLRTNGYCFQNYTHIYISTFVNKAWQLKREVLTQISCLHRKTWLMCPHISCSGANLHSQIQGWIFFSVTFKYFSSFPHVLQLPAAS